MNLSLFGKKIKNIRHQKGKNLLEVANAIGVDKSFLSKLENGIRRPSPSVLNSLLNYYKLDISTFNELYELSGLPSISSHNVGIEHNLNTKGKEVYKNMNQEMSSNQTGPQINVPNNLPILYSDSVWVTASPFGLVFDYGQRVGPTNQVNVVARVGLSKEHAEALLRVLVGKLKDMQLLTKKTEKKSG